MIGSKSSSNGEGPVCKGDWWFGICTLDLELPRFGLSGASRSVSTKDSTSVVSGLPISGRLNPGALISSDGTGVAGPDIVLAWPFFLLLEADMMSPLATFTLNIRGVLGVEGRLLGGVGGLSIVVLARASTARDSMRIAASGHTESTDQAWFGCRGESVRGLSFSGGVCRMCGSSPTSSAGFGASGNEWREGELSVSGSAGL